MPKSIVDVKYPDPYEPQNESLIADDWSMGNQSAFGWQYHHTKRIIKKQEDNSSDTANT